LIDKKIFQTISRKDLILLLLFSLVILFRYNFQKPNFVDGDRLKISSKVLSEPAVYTKVQYIKLFGLKTFLPKYPEINYGDYVVVEGTVKEGELSDPKLISHKESKNILIGFRKKIINFYNKTVPNKHAALLSGVVLGSKAGIERDFWERLRTSGTLHVVVASGMNVTLVGGFVLILFMTFASRRKAIVFTLVSIWIYSFLSGFDAPIVRAAIMGSIAFTAVGLGRIKSSWRILIISALVMLVIKPLWILDLGFILSFVSTASLMLFESKVNKLIQFVPSLLKEGLSTSLAAQIGVAPIIYITFGQFNILSPIINALVLWTIAPMTTLAMLGGIVGLIIPQIGKLIIYLTYPLTSWFIWIVEVFS